MPIHDWTRVPAGIFHAFHLSWIGVIQDYLNQGVLPDDYYAVAEQIIGPLGPDVLMLHSMPSNDSFDTDSNGGVAVMTKKPQSRFTAETELSQYAQKRRTVVIRHSSDDRIIALIEIVSPGNKAGRQAFNAFIDKAVECVHRGYHLLIVDLFPPGTRDPQGIHGAIWGEICDEAFTLPDDANLTVVAYSSGSVKRAYIEPVRFDGLLPEMPLFLEPEMYVNLPLETTYQNAYRGMANRWKRVLESNDPPANNS